MPQAAQAIARKSKFRDYLLDPGHPVGGHKARVFAATFGLQRNDAERFRSELLHLIRTNTGVVRNCRDAPLHRAGATTWTVDVRYTGPNGTTATIRTQWDINVPGTAPRFVTAWVDN